MNDWIGLGILIVFVIGIYVGLRSLAKPRQRTSEEFERNAAENTTMAGALFNALHDVTDPASARAKEVRMQMKDGAFRKKKREGKADGAFEEETSETGDLNER